MGGPDDEDPPVSGRRGFFRLGLQHLRQRVGDAVQSLGEASEGVATPQDSGAEPALNWVVDEDERAYHTVRVRQAGPKSQASTFIRPPGALPEQGFLEVCSRCGDCAAACPEFAIVKCGPQHGPHLEMTPVLEPATRPCLLCADVPCAAACPTGALTPVESHDIRLATAVVVDELCLNHLGQPCADCLHACPRPHQALILAVDADGEPITSAAGEAAVPRVSAYDCTGCGLCAAYCRAFPKAIFLEPRVRSVATREELP